VLPEAVRRCLIDLGDVTDARGDQEHQVGKVPILPFDDSEIRPSSCFGERFLLTPRHTTARRRRGAEGALWRDLRMHPESVDKVVHVKLDFVILDRPPPRHFLPSPASGFQTHLDPLPGPHNERMVEWEEYLSPVSPFRERSCV
jgi:hypothetical protein